jgi:hypothetical protein
LPDGASLFLCVGIELDRTGRRYPDGIDPDVKLPAPDSRPPEDKDAVLGAAEDWIVMQSSAGDSSGYYANACSRVFSLFGELSCNILKRLW